MCNIIIAVFLFSPLVHTGILLTNGAFEQELNIGWQSYKYSTMDTIARGTGYEPDPDADQLCWAAAAIRNIELTNLPGVPPSAIKQIQITGYDTTAHTY